MARYRRYRRTIIRAPKKKWASNIRELAFSTEGTVTLQYAVQTLVENASEAASPTPVILKTGNIKVQGDSTFAVTSSIGGFASVALYVVFVPQGVPVTSAVGANELIKNHPEWIMTWRYLNGDISTAVSGQNTDSFSFSSRLKRNLNSGDSVKMICVASGDNLSSVSIRCMAQYWTCAN